jgi:muramidase (phage lysozyme)
MGLRGFDPQTQRLMAAQLLQRANGGVPGNESALEALRRGDYDTALERAKLTWTSLPSAAESNKNINADQARAYYQERLKLYKPR